MFKKLLICAVAAIALCSCESEKHSRGFDYMPDMYESPAYKSQQGREVTGRYAKEVEGPADKDGKPTKKTVEVTETHQHPMMLTPPDGAIPRDFVPYQIDAADMESAKKVENPLSPTADVLKSGQQAFNIYCAVCHGNDGSAGASSYVGYKFGGILALNTDALLRLSDGEIYHIVTHGRGNMPNYRAQLPPQARWSVIHYVRALNGATLAKTEAEKALDEAEKAVADNKDPSKSAEKKAAVDTARKVVALKKQDLDLIKQGGTGAEFVPAPAPVPEYVKPEWPE